MDGLWDWREVSACPPDAGPEAAQDFTAPGPGAGRASLGVTSSSPPGVMYSECLL